MEPVRLPALHFKDRYTKDDEGFISVGASTGMIGVVVSLKSNGDLNFGMGVSDAKKLVERLQDAITIASK